MLEVKNLTFRVTDGGEATILDNLSFTVPSGQITVITGPNGGGKSTLAKLIMGIERPTSGQILLDGQDITGLSITERARLGIGYAFQQPPRFKGVTVRRLLELAHGSPLSEPACCNLLSRVGLCSQEYLKREVDASLSGGELKRIEIASLMARDVRLAIYDEPEAGIDLWSFSMLVDSFESFRTNPQQSSIIISHQERIIRLADEIIVIAGGRISAQGTQEEILPLLQGEVQNCACIQRQGGNGQC